MRWITESRTPVAPVKAPSAVVGLYRKGVLWRFSDHGLGRERSTLRVGASGKCDLVLGHGSLVSREHFALIWRAGLVWVRDLNSTNGTFLNKRRVAPGDANEVALQPLDRLLAGRVEFRVVDASLAVPSEGNTVSSYLRHAVDDHGGQREAARRVGKSRATIQRALQRGSDTGRE